VTDPSKPFEHPEPGETAREVTGRVGTDLWTQLRQLLPVTVGGPTLAGVVIALIWREWAPKTAAFVIAGADGKPVVIPDESESQIAGDGRYLLMTVLVGIAVGAATWLIRRQRGPIALLSLAIGSLLGSVVAWQLGSALATGRHTGALNSQIRLPLTLHATALVFAQALVAVVVYLVLTGLSSTDDLGASDRDQLHADARENVPAG
jgi:hypothetical protein